MAWRVFAVTVLLTVALGIACSDDAVNAPEKEGHLFETVVKDPSGAAVSGLSVSAWNQLSGVVVGLGSEPRSAAEPMATTTITFDVPLACDFEVIVYDFDGAQVDTLAAGAFLAGSHNFQWVTGGLPGGVYRCVARVLSGGISFVDTIYPVLWYQDPVMNELGYTGGDGRYWTDEQLRFPNTLELPELAYVNEVNEILGTFGYSDSVVIVLTDTMTGLHEAYTRQMEAGVNRFELIWDPAIIDRGIGRGTQDDGAEAAVLPGRDEISGFGASCYGPPPAVFHLHQNYPNPFN